MAVSPYKDSDANKKVQVEHMFDNIAHKYDFLNHFLSLGIDKLWRKKAVRILKKENPKKVIDVATGTGDFAVEIAKIKPDEIVGYDLSAEMIKFGVEKVKKKGLDKLISFKKGDSEDMPFQEASFDALTVAFGVRNFENLDKGLSEFYRVLKPGGLAVILEFSKPKAFPIKQLYLFYFFKILPLFGKRVSKDASAYEYLPESVMNFPEGEEFMKLFAAAGFKDIYQRRLTMGVATIYVGRK